MERYKLMRKSAAIILVLAFAVFGALAFSTRINANISAESAVAENPASESSAVPLKVLYARNCARCHGVDGKSQTELGQTLEAPDLTAKKTSVKRNVQVIANGEGAMPGFAKKLKKTEIDALANYVRKL